MFAFTYERGRHLARLLPLDQPEHRICSQPDPLHLVLREAFLRAVVELGDARTLVRRHFLRVLELTRDRRVECAERDRDRYDRVVAGCCTESGELNTAMVRRGLAVDYMTYSGGRDIGRTKSRLAASG